MTQPALFQDPADRVRVTRDPDTNEWVARCVDCPHVYDRSSDQTVARMQGEALADRHRCGPGELPEQF